MSTNATILAIGPYSKAIAEHLEYPASWYENMKPGQPVVTEFGQDDMVTRDSARQIASALGVTLDDPATWEIRRENIEWAELSRPPGTGDQWLLVATLSAFLRAGFKLYFRLDA